MFKRNFIQSGKYRDVDKLIDALMALPPARYIEGNSKTVAPSDGYEIMTDCAGITSAASAKPILGTLRVTDCMAVSVFNPEEKIGGLAHLSSDTKDDLHLSKDGRKALAALIAAARGEKGSGKLEVRISGPGHGMGGMGRVFSKDVAKVLNDTPGLTFLSADFGGKEYPFDVGMDARRWNEGLLKGRNPVITVSGEARAGSDMQLHTQRFVEGMRGVVVLEDLPAAPHYNDDNLFDARGLGKYSGRDKPPGIIER